MAVCGPRAAAVSLDERTTQARALRSMRPVMSDDFAARCTGCRFTWNTPAMVEGLRVLGGCPKCKGELEFGRAARRPGGRAERSAAAGRRAAPGARDPAHLASARRT